MLRTLFAILVLSLFNSTAILADEFNNENSINYTSLQISQDSSTSAVQTITQDSLHIAQKDFYYADNPLYTITGELPNKTTKIKPIPAIIIGGVYTGVFILQHIGQMNTIWKDRTDFRFQEDGDYGLYVDKIGHFYGCYTTSYIARESFMWAGFSRESSVWLGSLLGLGYSTYVEILDGYGINWGFSPSDFYCDVAGTAFSVAQYYVPYLQNFSPKFQYIPSPWFGERKRIPSEIFIDDYSSQVFWMSANIHNMLPDNLKSFWPSWLQLSFGYTARNLTVPGSPGTEGRHYDEMRPNVYGDPKYILALDYDLTKILPDGGSFWNWLRQSLNLVKLPSPAIEFSKSSTKFYLIYPFPINLGSIRL